MKALQISAPGKVDVVYLAEPALKDGEVLLKVKYVGFCGSDLNTYRGNNTMAKPHVIPGHEIGAEVMEIGKDVPQCLVRGMNVTVNPYTSCGVCSSCRNSRPNACRDNQTLGVQRDGAMAEYIAVPWRKIIPATRLRPEITALVEPMSVGFHSVARGQVSDTDIVVVIGCGMVGLGAMIRASLRGAIVIAADIDDGKLSVARSLGADYVLNTKSPDFRERLMELTHGYGPDVVIEAVGSPATYRLAVDVVAYTGRVVCIGYSKDDVTFTTKLFVQKELDIRGSRNALPSDFEAVISFLERNEDAVVPLITRVVGFEDADESLKYWSDNPGEVFRILLKL